MIYSWYCNLPSLYNSYVLSNAWISNEHGKSFCVITIFKMLHWKKLREFCDSVQQGNTQSENALRRGRKWSWASGSLDSCSWKSKVLQKDHQTDNIKPTYLVRLHASMYPKGKEMEMKHLVVGSEHLTALHFRVFVSLGFHWWKPWSAETLHTSRRLAANKQENEELTFQIYTWPLGSTKVSKCVCRYGSSLNISVI